MCSIAGYVAKKENIDFAREKFTNILLAGEVRGTDACGVAFNTGKHKFYYCKAPVPASKFINENIYKELMKDYRPCAMIGHNRAQTQGDKTNNFNNHPIVTKTGLSMIHNGMIHNDKELAEEYHLAPDGEVDSEVIVRMIEYFIYVEGKNTRQAIQEMAKKVRGSMAIALLNAKEPHSVYLMASSNPITLSYHIPTGTIFFASTETILKKGLVDYDYFFNGLFKRETGVGDYVFEEMADDTGVKITPQGWETFEIERPAYQTNYQSSSGCYGSRSAEIVDKDGEFGHDDDSFSSVGDTIYEKQQSGIYTPSEKPIIAEADGNTAIIKALNGVKGFDVFDVIKKPGDYLSELLLYRLEYIQELLFSGDYQIEYDEEGMVKLESEVRRILNTLESRKKKTKRILYVPEFDEIWNLMDGGELGMAYPDVEWVLAKKNKDLCNIMKKAEGFEDLSSLDKEEYQDVPSDPALQGRLLCE